MSDAYIEIYDSAGELIQYTDGGGRTPSGELYGLDALMTFTPLQSGMLFHSLMAPESGVYANQVTCTLPADLDSRLFQQAWEQLVQRHGVLRTAFLWDGLDDGSLARVRHRDAHPPGHVRLPGTVLARGVGVRLLRALRERHRVGGGTVDQLGGDDAGAGDGEPRGVVRDDEVEMPVPTRLIVVVDEQTLRAGLHPGSIIDLGAEASHDGAERAIDALRRSSA